MLINYDNGRDEFYVSPSLLGRGVPGKGSSILPEMARHAQRIVSVGRDRGTEGCHMSPLHQQQRVLEIVFQSSTVIS